MSHRDVDTTSRIFMDLTHYPKVCKRKLEIYREGSVDGMGKSITFEMQNQNDYIHPWNILNDIMNSCKVGHISNDYTFWYFGTSPLCRYSAPYAGGMPPSTAVNLYVDWVGFTARASCIWISNHEISCPPNRFMSRSLTFTVLATTPTGWARSSRRTT